MKETVVKTARPVLLIGIWVTDTNITKCKVRMEKSEAPTEPNEIGEYLEDEALNSGSDVDGLPEIIMVIRNGKNGPITKSWDLTENGYER